MSNKHLAFLTIDDYNYIIQNEKRPFLIFFSAKWDENCKNMTESMENIAHDNYEQLKVYGCDIDDAPLCAAKSNIISIPCLAIYKDGKEFLKSVGYREQNEIEELLRKHEVI